MKFSKVLIPEMVKGTRYENGEAKFVFKLLTSVIEFEEQGISYPQGEGVFKDINYMSAFCQAKRHLIEKGEVYHLCRDFGEVLRDLRDREVSIDYLPKSLNAYVSLPKGLVGDVQGAYIYIGPADNRTLISKDNWGEKFIWIGYFGNFREDGDFSTGRVFFPLEDSKGHTVESFLGRWEKDTSDPDVAERISLTKLLINVALYLNSQDPEILTLKPSFGSPVSKQKAHTINNHVNLCTVPVKAINWDYSKVREYSTDKIFVDRFMAWRRCGPNHSQIKLTWISEHQREVRKVVKNQISDPLGYSR